MKKLLSYAAVLLVFMFFALPVPIFAQEEGAVVTMEETVVTASRIEELLKYSPDSVTIVTGEEIQKKENRLLLMSSKMFPVFPSRNMDRQAAVHRYICAEQIMLIP